MKTTMILMALLCFRWGSNPPQLLDSSRQRWVAGIRGAGAGENFEFIIRTTADSRKLVFNGLWVGSEYLEFTVSRKFPALPHDGFKKGDTVYLNATRFFEVDGFTPPPRIEKAPPFEYRGQALIACLLNNKQHYLEVPEIRQKPSEHYE